MALADCPVAPECVRSLLALDDWALDHQAEVLAELRAAGSMVWVPGLDAFAVTEHAELSEVLTDHERFSSALGNPRGPRVAEIMQRAGRELAGRPEADELFARLVPDWRAEPYLISTDPPVHTVHRRAVNRLFTPRKVAKIRPRAEQIARVLVEAIDASGTVDLNWEFAVPLPLRVIAEELWVGTDDLPAFKRWSDDLVSPIGNDRLGPDEMLSILRTVVEVSEYFRPLFASRRADPQDDFITLVATAEDDDVPISDEQRLGLVSSMLGAGNETTTKMLSGGCFVLAQRPDLAAKLRAEPELIPVFVDEILRLETRVQGLFRTARHDTELGGVKIPAGSWVWALYASANRSEGEYVCPHELRLDRENSNTHLSFGRGVHYCPGAALSRMEGEVGFGALLDRFEGWTVLDYERDPSCILHGFRRLAVQFVT